MATTNPTQGGSESPQKRANHNESHHAHFVEPRLQDDLTAHDSKILVEPIGDDKVRIRLGFLQFRHVYQVNFPIEDDLGEDVSFDPLEKLHAKIVSANPREDGTGHDVVVEFSAAREKIMQEAVSLTSLIHPARKLVLEFHARVLGKGKGTPSLKAGIHCVRIDNDEETEDSDWQGFS